ncbi:hypothetical protein [Pseudodesulfovibrio karagichevae]|uniref:Uncharacterized protein n=1 Tax=Pseudodesulfovibrio karagichevae TaxID=3239305 RepID=A0ABV4K6J0_9BACT
MTTEISLQEIEKILESAETERDKLLSLMNENMSELKDKGEYQTAKLRYLELLDTISRLNGISAGVRVENLTIQAGQLAKTTKQINDTVASVQTVTKYLALVGSLLDIAKGIIVSSNPAGAIVTAIDSANSILAGFGQP